MIKDVEKDNITISVIIPVYNVSAYIEGCLQSVIDQTYNDFECILVDDASPDDSIAKCKRMIADYDGPISFRIIYHPENRGLSAARNTGTAAATGDYIMYVDSDDVIKRDCIEKLKAPLIQDNSIEMVLGNVVRVINGVALQQSLAIKQDSVDIIGNSDVRNFFFNKKGMIQASWNKLISKAFVNNYGLSF